MKEGMIFLDYSQAIVVRNDFTNIHLKGHGSTIHHFIQDYAARPDATQSAPLDEMTNQWIEHINQYYQEDQFNSQKTFEDLASNYLMSEGVSFDNFSLSLDTDQLKNDAWQIQQGYLNGHTVQKLIISFDTDYLINQNIVDMQHFQDRNGKQIAQAFPGGGFDLVDEYKLRYAVQNGVNAYVNNNGMLNPCWVGALQYDRQHVHAHIACCDLGDLAQSNRLMHYQGVYQDRGKINAEERQMIRNSIDGALTLTKGLHRNVASNQRAREIVNVKSLNYELQTQYQQRLASQLLLLLRLNETRLQQSHEIDDELYWDKLSDYRDSLVMEEAQQFGLPANLSNTLKDDLNHALDEQITNLNKEGVPDQNFIKPAHAFFTSSLGSKLQNQMDSNFEDSLTINHNIEGWHYLINDYNRQFQRGLAGNGSLSMFSLYGFELETSLHQLSAKQAENPLGLLSNYNYRQDLVDWRKQLLDRRERILEQGYKNNLLINPDQNQLKSLLKDPNFQRNLLKIANTDKQSNYWIAKKIDTYTDVQDVPAFQDLLLKSQSVGNLIGVSPQNARLIGKASGDQMLERSLLGFVLNRDLKRALSLGNNDFSALKQNYAMQQFVNDLREYQSDVIAYTIMGTQRGLLRPREHLLDSQRLLIPDSIQRPLDVRNNADVNAWGFLNVNKIDAMNSQQMTNYLMQEQAFLKNAQRYLGLTNQQSPVVSELKVRQRNRIIQLNDVDSTLSRKVQTEINSDDAENRQLIVFNHRDQNSNGEPKMDFSGTERANVLKRQRTRRENNARLRMLQNVRQQEMNTKEAETVVSGSKKIVHQVLLNELGA